MTHSLQVIRENLRDYLQSKMFAEAEVTINEFFQASGGWTDETYVLSAEANGQIFGLVIRKLKKGSLLSGERNLSQQYRLLDLLSNSTSLPVPKVYLLEEDPSIIGGEFMIMEKLQGQSYVPWSKEGKAFL